MPDPGPPRESPVDPPAAGARLGRLAKGIFLALLLAWLAVMFWNSAKPLPPGTHLASQISRLSEADVEFSYDSPRRPASVAQDLAAIDHAEQLIVLDRSPVSAELAQHLLARKHQRPSLKIVLVTDPGHEAFGGTAAQILTSLETAGIIVARVRLDRLRDSNALYSGLWRLAFAWWSDAFDEVPAAASLPARSRRQNFKADQRQLVVADDGSGGWVAVIAPARATASLVLRGSLAHAIIAGVLQTAAWSAEDDRLPLGPPLDGRGVGSIDARFLTEGAIHSALLDAIAAAGGGDRLSLAVENLGDRQIIAALLRAAARGAQLQVLLAWNLLPNQPVADELLRDSGGRIEVRWYPPDEGALQPKLLVVRHGGDMWLNLGSANFTRRNLGDLNLEAGVELRLPARAAPARAVAEYFGQRWAGASVDPRFAQASAAAYWLYRFEEATGLSSF